MDENATWYGSRPRPRPHCVRREPSSPRESGTAASPLFGPCLLWPRSPISATAELLLRFFGLPFIKRFALCYDTVVRLSILSVCDVGVLWRNGWIDQLDETWRAGRPQPGHIVLYGDQLFPPKGRSPKIFGPYLLWPNGWMDQGDTWHGGGLRSRHIVLDRNPAPFSEKEAEPLQFSAHFYCGQTAACIRIGLPLGMEVGLSLGDIALDEDPAPPPLIRGTQPSVWTMSVVAKRLYELKCHLVWS